MHFLARPQRTYSQLKIKFTISHYKSNFNKATATYLCGPPTLPVYRAMYSKRSTFTSWNATLAHSYKLQKPSYDDVTYFSGLQRKVREKEHFCKVEHPLFCIQQQSTCLTSISWIHKWVSSFELTDKSLLTLKTCYAFKNELSMN